MTTQEDSARLAEMLSHKWQQEHRALELFFDDFRKWAYEVTQRGLPHFGETADRLKQLRLRLMEHFDREYDLANQFVVFQDSPSPEVDANRQQVADDHSILLARLDGLIAKLDELDPPFVSWQEAIEQVEGFIAAFDQHEEQEADSIKWLLPKKG